MIRMICAVANDDRRATTGAAMSGPSHQREQQERKEALASDRKLRPGEHEPSTMFAMANLGIDTSVSSGRQGKEYVSGSEPHVSYPSAAGPWADPVRVPDEPSLGYAINDLVPCGQAFEIAASLSAAGASAAVGRAEVAAPILVDHPTANVVERASATSSSELRRLPKSGDGVNSKSIARIPSPHPSLHRPVRKL